MEVPNAGNRKSLSEIRMGVAWDSGSMTSWHGIHWSPDHLENRRKKEMQYKRVSLKFCRPALDQSHSWSSSAPCWMATRDVDFGVSPSSLHPCCGLFPRLRRYVLVCTNPEKKGKYSCVKMMVEIAPTRKRNCANLWAMIFGFCVCLWHSWANTSYSIESYLYAFAERVDGKIHRNQKM